MGNFLKWFNSKLITGRYPTPGEIVKSDFDTIINVSDEYIAVNHIVATENKTKFRKYFWFPLNENGGNIGLNSIFGALQILWLSEHNNEKVYLHCHAGANRSVTVAQLYYWMRTKTDFIETNKNEAFTEEDWFKMFNITTEVEKASYRKMNKQNRVQNNIEAGHLPARILLEHFLKECEQAFQKYEIGNISLDGIKSETKLLSY